MIHRAPWNLSLLQAIQAFSVWYANKGFGRLQSMPAFDEKAMDKAVKRA